MIESKFDEFITKSQQSLPPTTPDGEDNTLSGNDSSATFSDLRSVRGSSASPFVRNGSSFSGKQDPTLNRPAASAAVKNVSTPGR